MGLAWLERGLDLDSPSPSRVYDCLLGGSHNFRADRDAAERLLAVEPDAGIYARANRAFLRRAVGHLSRAGVRQFIDIGSGIPTAGNVHEIARRHDPSAHVVYVDVDPVAVEHSRSLLADDPCTDVVQADVRDAHRILDSSAVRKLINFREPVAVLLVALLHFVPDIEEASGAVTTLTTPTPPGSFLVISHGAWPEDTDRSTADAVASYEREVAGLRLRDRSEIRRFFAGFRLMEPGLVPPGLWRPEGGDDPTGDRTPALVGIGVKATGTDAAAAEDAARWRIR